MSAVMDLLTREEEEQGRHMYSFKFLNVFDNVDTERFLEMGRNLATRGRNRKMSMRRIRKGVR